LVGSLLTAAIASRFVKQERGEEHVEVMETLRQIKADVAELKSRTDDRDEPPASQGHCDS